AVDASATSLGGRGHPLFTWLRLQRTVGRESRLGMVYTGRDDGAYGNHVAGADARLVFSKTLSVQALAALSHTADPTSTRVAPLEQKAHFNTNYTLRGGWRAGASVLLESFGYDPDLYRRFAIERHIGFGVDTVPFVGTPRLPNLDYVLSVTSPNFRYLSFNVL